MDNVQRFILRVFPGIKTKVEHIKDQFSKQRDVMYFEYNGQWLTKTEMQDIAAKKAFQDTRNK